MSERLEFPLAQGWTKGLVLCFEDKISSLQFDWTSAANVQQVHGKDIVECTSLQQLGEQPFATADGIFARGEFFKSSQIKLVVKTADCMPLIMVDRQSECVVAIHAGWRGLVAGIHRVPFEKKLLDPKFTWVWCGPSLNGKNFEVGEDMWSQFLPEYTANEKFFSKHSDPAKRYFHSWNFIEHDLRLQGVDMVYNVEVDTFEGRSFASHRRSLQNGEKRLSNLSWVGFGSS